MRYPKGSTIISTAFDIPLLLQVRNSRFVSRQQLLEFMQHDGLINSYSSYCSRLLDLLKSRHIQLLEDLNWQGSSVYSIARNGLMELESRGEFAIALNSRTRYMPHRIQAFHSLELNNIRLALTRNSLLAAWRSEIEIASQNLVSGTYEKDYDAVVSVWRGDQQQEFALEYERSLKAASRYARIRAALERERRVPAILYLCAGTDLMLALIYHLTPLAKPVAFATAPAFLENLLATTVMTGSDGALQRLDTFLESSSLVAARGEVCP